MEASTETAVRREIAIAARPETVWEFLVQPEKATRWMGKAASLDPRPGGEYRAEVISGNVALGEFVEVDPPHRLVWTWGWTDESQSPVPVGSTRIEVELEPDGDGGTLLRFTHSGLPDADAPPSTRTGGITTSSASVSRRAATTRAVTPGSTR
jgi:uncharacterized protein YndB with AHSA1/START domain